MLFYIAEKKSLLAVKFMELNIWNYKNVLNLINQVWCTLFCKSAFICVFEELENGFLGSNQRDPRWNS